MKTSFLVMLVAIMSLAAAGIFLVSGNSTRNASATPAVVAVDYRVPTVQPASGAQEVSLRALDAGVYDKESMVVEANRPVKLRFSADPGAACGRSLILKEFGVSLVSKNGEEQVAEFTPAPGKYEYRCPMRMFRGTLEAR